MRIMKLLGWCSLFALSLAVIAACDATYAGTMTMNAETGGLIFLGFAGLLVNKDTISAVFISLKTEFNNAFSAAESNWQKIAMKVPSTTGQNDYTWLSKFPKMREWLGDKVVKALQAYKYTIDNKDWEATVEVDRNDIEDDSLGMYGPQSRMAGESAAQLPDEIVMSLVTNGFSNLCYDGQYFYDTDHSVAGASVSNRLTVALSCSTLAAAIASYGAARTAMMKFKDDEGRPLNLKPDVMVVPPALEAIALVLANNERLEDGKQNPYRGTFTVVVDARLATDTEWHLLDTSKPVKPFIYQERKAPVFVEQIDSNSDDVFTRKKFKFGAEARANGGYGFWQMAVGSTGAG